MKISKSLLIMVLSCAALTSAKTYLVETEPEYHTDTFINHFGPFEDIPQTNQQVIYYPPDATDPETTVPAAAAPAAVAPAAAAPAAAAPAGAAPAAAAPAGAAPAAGASAAAAPAAAAPTKTGRSYA